MRNNFIRLFIKTAAVITILSVMMTAVSCSKEKNKTSSYKDFIGEESYDSPIFAMVLENIEDEEEPGIIYREVTEFHSLINNCDIPVCLYFYSSTATDRAGITAGVEDIAQKLDGRILVIGIDIMTQREIVSEYEVAYVPDFVLVKNREEKIGFNSISYEYWTAADVYNWLIEQGV